MNNYSFNLEPFNFKKVITFLKSHIVLLLIIFIITSIFLFALYICKEHTTNKDIISVLKGETKGAVLTKQCIRLKINDNNLIDGLYSLLEDSRYFINNKVCYIEFLNFPSNFNSINNGDIILMNKAVFIKMILPLIIKANKEVLDDREKVLFLSSKMPKDDLSDRDMEVFKYLIKKYNIVLQINTPWDVLSGINQLLVKVNYIPNSLVLAVAIRESNWGTSVMLKNHNSLFAEKDYYNSKKPKPCCEYKNFKNLDECVKSFVQKLNNKTDYSDFRNARYKQIDSRYGISSLKLASYLDANMNTLSKKRPSLESIIKNNNLLVFDKYNDLYEAKKLPCIYFR